MVAVSSPADNSLQKFLTLTPPIGSDPIVAEMSAVLISKLEAFRKDPVDILAIRSRGDQSVGRELCFYVVLFCCGDVKAPFAAGFVITFDRCSMTLLGRITTGSI